MATHQNSQQRFYHKGMVYFVTSNTAERVPWFESIQLCEVWLNTLILCKTLKQFKIHAFCLNHDHFHLLVEPSGKFDISQIMHSFKLNTAMNINKFLMGIDKYDRKLHEGEDSNPRLQHLCRRYPHQGFQWQRSFHDHYIRSERDFISHLRYTQFNFLKHNLPDDWKYTSLNYDDLIDEL